MRAQESPAGRGGHGRGGKQGFSQAAGLVAVGLCASPGLPEHSTIRTRQTAGTHPPSPRGQGSTSRAQQDWLLLEAPREAEFHLFFFEGFLLDLKIQLAQDRLTGEKPTDLFNTFYVLARVRKWRPKDVAKPKCFYAGQREETGKELKHAGCRRKVELPY